MAVENVVSQPLFRVKSFVAHFTFVCSVRQEVSSHALLEFVAFAAYLTLEWFSQLLLADVRGLVILRIFTFILFLSIMRCHHDYQTKTFCLVPHSLRFRQLEGDLPGSFKI